MSVRRTALAATLALVAGVAVAHVATDGFEAYTLESARRLQALRAPVAVPDVEIDFIDGGRARFSAMRERVLLVDFIYTNCPTVCTVLGSVDARLQRGLAPEIAAGEVRLVTITIDPARDTPGNLKTYRARHTADAGGWDLGRIERADELRSVLDAFGVVVIPDGAGGFVHNAAMHVVGPDRKLVAIANLDDIAGIVNTVRDVARKSRHVEAR